jgi:phosphatidylglycerol:prolipoprotein diacylglycerol transferase
MFLIPFPMIDPVALDLGVVSVYWYGIAYLVGIVVAWGYARRIGHLFNLTEKQIDDFITWEVVGIVLGGRLGYVLFYDAAHFFTNPIEMLYTRQGGMSFHGGFLGVVIATILYCRKMRIPLMTFGDMLAVIAPVGLFFGRLANFVNAEHYGRPTDVYWAMIFPKSDALPRHPSQLYEAIGEGILLAFLMWLVLRWLLKSAHKAGAIRVQGNVDATAAEVTSSMWKPGRLSGMFMLGYGVIRFGLEFFRHPDGFICFLELSLTLGQALCLPMIALGSYWLIRR